MYYMFSCDLTSDTPSLIYIYYFFMYAKNPVIVRVSHGYFWLKKTILFLTAGSKNEIKFYLFAK